MKDPEGTRFRFLRHLYEMSGGDRNANVMEADLAQRLGLSKEETDLVVQYLQGEGLLAEATFGTIVITHAGVKVGERLRGEEARLAAAPVSAETPEPSSVAELKRHRGILQGILERFVQSRDELRIRKEDDPLLRQTVNEIVDLLDEELGKNRLSWQIENEFKEGHENFFRTPSHKSVENIVAVVGAAITKLTRQNARSSAKPEVRPTATPDAPEWDAFISHASEDKAEVVEPLAAELTRRGLKVWYDRSVLRIGDSLRRKIDEGLAKSRYGIVVLSPSFFRKQWPQLELDGLVQREVDGRKVILPIWHKVGHEEVKAYSLMLADKVAGSTQQGMALLADQIAAVIDGPD